MSVACKAPAVEQRTCCLAVDDVPRSLQRGLPACHSQAQDVLRALQAHGTDGLDDVTETCRSADRSQQGDWTILDIGLSPL